MTNATKITQESTPLITPEIDLEKGGGAASTEQTKKSGKISRPARALLVLGIIATIQTLVLAIFVSLFFALINAVISLALFTASWYVNKCAGLDEINKALKVRNEDLKKTNTELKQTSESLKETNTKLSNEVSEMKTENETFQASNTQLAASVSELTLLAQGQDALNDKCRELAREVMGLQEKETEKLKEINALTGKLAATEALLTEHTKSLKETDAQRDASTEQLQANTQLLSEQLQLLSRMLTALQTVAKNPEDSSAQQEAAAVQAEAQKFFDAHPALIGK